MRFGVKVAVFLAGWILLSMAGYVVVSQEIGMLIAMLYLPVAAVVPNVADRLSVAGRNVG
jgi:hypothetical protein